MQHWSVQDLQANLASHIADDTPPLLLDVREPWEYDIGHLANTQLIPMNQIPQRLEELPTAQDIVVICHHGIRSRQVGLFLEHNNFTHIINLSGGMDAWARQVDTTMATY